MKYLVISDIHGSYDSTIKAIEKFNKFNCDKIIILGDILYHGPRNDLPDSYNPKQVINLLNRYKDKIIAIQGNCDAEVDQMVLDFKINNDLVMKIDDITFLLTHGHHINYLNPTNKKVDVVLHGHTHIYRVDKVYDVDYINLGSITIPKENTERCYAIINDNNLVVYDLNDKELLAYKGK